MFKVQKHTVEKKKTWQIMYFLNSPVFQHLMSLNDIQSSLY